MIGDILYSVGSHINLKGVSPLGVDNKPDFANTATFNDLEDEWLASLSDGDKKTYEKYKNTLKIFKQRGFLNDEYPTFEVGVKNYHKTRLINVGSYIIALSDEAICKFNTIEDFWEGGNGKCVWNNEIGD